MLLVRCLRRIRRQGRNTCSKPKITKPYEERSFTRNGHLVRLVAVSGQLGLLVDTKGLA